MKQKTLLLFQLLLAVYAFYSLVTYSDNDHLWVPLFCLIALWVPLFCLLGMFITRQVKAKVTRGSTKAVVTSQENRRESSEKKSFTPLECLLASRTVLTGMNDALDVQARLSESTVERRLYNRVKVRWPTTLVTSDGTIDGMTRALSLGGVFFYYSQTDSCALRLSADDRVDVVFNIPGHDQIQARARVAWADILAVEEASTVVGVGLEFVDVRRDDREYLLQAITEKVFWARDKAA